MEQMVRLKTTISKDGKLSIKGLPFPPGETVEVTVRAKKQTKSTKKYPLRGKAVVYHAPFNGVADEDWEARK
jgi:hypothetical protein